MAELWRRSAGTIRHVSDHPVSDLGVTKFGDWILYSQKPTYAFKLAGRGDNVIATSLYWTLLSPVIKNARLLYYS